MDEAIRQELTALLPRLRRFAYGLTGSQDEGDDVVQSACERALGRLHQWRPGTRLDSWMYRIVQNLWIDRVRSRRSRPEADPEILEQIPGGDAEREMQARLDLARVRRLVALLPAEQREVLLLVTVEGQSYKDAAATLEIPIGTVMSRLARARVGLGRMMEGGVQEPSDRPARPALRVVE